LSSMSRRRFRALALSRVATLCAPLFLAGCATSSPKPVATPACGGASVFDATLQEKEATPEVTTSELRSKLADPRVVVLDARPAEEYAVSHIPGARSVPGIPGLSAALYTADAKEARRMVPDLSTPVVVYCNGLFCGRSKRFAAELVKAGYANVRRYQLGIPAWRALGGVTQVEKTALVRLVSEDRTSLLVDAREGNAPSPPLATATRITAAEVPKAKDDGRLPMTDHNTRILVVAETGKQARATAEAIIHAAFSNVSFFDGSVTELPELAAVGPK
jgi:prepilin-type processing-associated H-X9-DG protein